MRGDPEGLLHPARLDDHGTRRHRRRLPTDREIPAPEHVGFRRMEKTARRAREHPAVLLAAGAMLLSGGLLLHYLSRLTFWRDEWEILLHRRGWSVGTFLDPAVEHLIAIPILIYKLLLAVAGMDSPLPFQVVAVLGFLDQRRAALHLRPQPGRASGSHSPRSSPSSSSGPPGTTFCSRTRSPGSAPSPAASARCSASTATAATRTSSRPSSSSAGSSSPTPAFPSWPGPSVEVALGPRRKAAALRPGGPDLPLGDLVPGLGAHRPHLRLLPQRREPAVVRARRPRRRASRCTSGSVSRSASPTPRRSPGEGPSSCWSP